MAAGHAGAVTGFALAAAGAVCVAAGMSYRRKLRWGEVEFEEATHANEALACQPCSAPEEVGPAAWPTVDECQQLTRTSSPVVDPPLPMFSISPVLNARTITNRRPAGAEASPSAKRGRGGACGSDAVVAIGRLPHEMPASDDAASGLGIAAYAPGVSIDLSGLICTSADAIHRMGLQLHSRVAIGCRRRNSRIIRWKYAATVELLGGGSGAGADIARGGGCGDAAYSGGDSAAAVGGDDGAADAGETADFDGLAVLKLSSGLRGEALPTSDWGDVDGWYCPPIGPPPVIGAPAVCYGIATADSYSTAAHAVPPQPPAPRSAPVKARVIRQEGEVVAGPAAVALGGTSLTLGFAADAENEGQCVTRPHPGAAVVNPHTGELVGLVIGAAPARGRCNIPAGACTPPVPDASAFLPLEPIFRHPLFRSLLRGLGAARPTGDSFFESDQLSGETEQFGGPLQVAPAC
jgi:hypothetical protein